MLGLDGHRDGDPGRPGRGGHAEQLGQRDHLALVGGRLHLQPAPEVDLLKLLDGEVPDRAERRTVQGQGVEADELVVGAEVDVALQGELGTSLRGPVDRCRVGGPGRHLGVPRPTAPVRDDL